MRITAKIYSKSPKQGYALSYSEHSPSINTAGKKKRHNTVAPNRQAKGPSPPNQSNPDITCESMQQSDLRNTARKASTRPRQLRHPAEGPRRIRRLDHVAARPRARAEEAQQEEDDERRGQDGHDAARRGADLALVQVGGGPLARGRRQGRELLAAEGVVDEPAEGDAVAGELEGADPLGAEDDGEGDEEDGL